MLKLKYKDSATDAVWLAEPGITIGSDQVSTLVIDAPDVRGFHADVRVGADGVWIKDVGSASGTFVNGKPVTKETPLRAGDVLAVGATELLVVDPQDATSRDPTDAVPALGTDTGEAAAAGSWALLALNGPLQGRSFALQAKTVVGRAEECELSIPEARLSREHAQLVLAGDLLSIKDLGSSNGTFHNGSRVERALLAVGDTVGFDKLEFRVLGPAPQVSDGPVDDDGFDKTIITTASASIAKGRTAASPQATTGVNPQVAQAPVSRSRSVSSTGRASGPNMLLIGVLVAVALTVLLLFVV